MVIRGHPGADAKRVVPFVGHGRGVGGWLSIQATETGSISDPRRRHYRRVRTPTLRPFSAFGLLARFALPAEGEPGHGRLPSLEAGTAVLDARPS